MHIPDPLEQQVIEDQKIRSIGCVAVLAAAFIWWVAVGLAALIFCYFY